MIGCWVVFAAIWFFICAPSAADREYAENWTRISEEIDRRFEEEPTDERA